MSVPALARAVSSFGKGKLPSRIHVGAALFHEIYEEMKLAEQRTGKWMRWTEPTIDAPNLMFMGIPAVMDSFLPPDVFSLKE